MKRMIVNNFNDLNSIYRITVDVVYEKNADYVASSEILPLQNPDGSYDELALSDYEDFIIEVLELFYHHGLDVLEERESPFSKSAYYSLVRTEDMKNADYKFILFIRLSDHENRQKTRTQKMKFYDEHAQELKQPSSKRHQLWKLKEITVNRQTFNTYEEALDAIDKRLSAYDNLK